MHTTPRDVIQLGIAAALLVVGLGLGYLGGSMALEGPQIDKPLQDRMARMVPTTGRIVEARFDRATDSASKGTWNFVYEFTAPDGKSYRGDFGFFTPSRDSSKRRVGDPVTVFYDPTRPSLSSEQGQQERFIKEGFPAPTRGIGLFVLGVSAALAYAGALLAKATLQKRKARAAAPTTTT